MPTNIDNHFLHSQFLDKRVKLLDCQKERLIAMHESGLSQRALARIFHVDRRTVQFTLNPDKLVQNRAIKRNYYDRQANTAYGRTYRARKREILIPFINQNQSNGTY